MGVGTQMKKVLRERKMTIKELSEKIDVPLNTLYSISRRDSERVDRVILQRIADSLNVSVNYLTDEVELKAPLPIKYACLLNSIFHWAKEENISREDLCKQLGLPLDEWHRWMERSSFSYLDYLPQIANVFGVPQRVFQKYVDGTFRKESTDYEEEMLLAFRQLNPYGQDIAVERIRELSKIEDYRKNIESK